MSEKTCSETINENFERREEFLDSLYECIDNNTEHEEIIDPYDFLYSELALCVDEIFVAKIQLSTGGPGDWIEAFYDRDGVVYRVEYHTNDWWDHASIRVPEGSSIWRYAESMVELVRYT